MSSLFNLKCHAILCGFILTLYKSLWYIYDRWLSVVADRERERGEESRLISKSNKLIKHEPMQRVYFFYDDTHFRPR